jgi:hypothetical protein
MKQGPSGVLLQINETRAASAGFLTPGFERYDAQEKI